MKQYLELLQAIKNGGAQKPPAREGMPGSLSLFGYQFRHNLQDGFPLLTTKKMFWKGVVAELLWFLRGDTNIKYLVDTGVNIWNEDAYNYYLKKCKEGLYAHEKPLSFEWFIDLIQKSGKGDSRYDAEISHPKFNGYRLGDCGYQYGKVWRSWEAVDIFEQDTDYNNYYSIDQIKNVITSLKNNPEGRRHIVTAIDPAHQDDLALYWCHAMFQFNCRPIPDIERKVLLCERPEWKDHFAMVDEDPSGDIMETVDELGIPKYYLDCHLYQRSADVVLGVPFNIASYALLTHIIAKMCNMIPGDLIISYGDVHIYDNHMDAVNEQLTREPIKLPELKINNIPFEAYNQHNDLDNFIQTLDSSDFILQNYNPYPAIKAELSTGLKK